MIFKFLCEHHPAHLAVVIPVEGQVLTVDAGK